MKYGTIEITIAVGGPSFGIGVLPTGTVMLSPGASAGIRIKIDDTPPAGINSTLIDEITVCIVAAVVIVYEQIYEQNAS